MEGIEQQTGRRGAPLWVYHAMLLLAAALWGLGTVVIKDTIDVFPPLWLVGFRFLFAAVISTLVLLPRVMRNLNRDMLAVGALLGVPLSLTYLLNSTGLLFTTASKSVFFTNTYCVMMPFIIWVVMRRRPVRANFAAAGLCIAGVSLVTFAYGLGTVNFNVGDALTLCSALAVGVHLTLVAHFAKGRDMLVLTCVQFAVTGAVSLACGMLLEGPLDFAVFHEPGVMGSLAYLVVFASCVTLMLQNVSLAKVNTMTGSLLLATECIFGVVFAAMLLGESVNLVTVCGFVLIAVAIVVNEVFSARER